VLTKPPLPQTLFLASDHAGYGLKAHLSNWLQEQFPEMSLQDVGCFDAATSVDYPLVVKTFAESFKEQPEAMGLLLCGSGVGVCVAANRFPWLRAVHAHDVLLAQLSRQHNNANVLCMGARFVAAPLAESILEAWLQTSFDGDRHQRRVSQLADLGEAPSLEALPSCSL
jgi:ribose 5-phosphate isomerase B